MERTVEKLNMSGVYVLIDGNRVPFGLRGKGEAIIGGDRKSFCIAARLHSCKSESRPYDETLGGDLPGIWI